MDSDQSIQDNYLERRCGQELLKPVTRFIQQRAGLQHSPLNTPQHLGAGAARAAAEASTSTNTIDPGTSEERHIQVKTLLRELHRQYRAAEIRQHSPLKTQQHLGVGAAPAAAEASTSTNTIDPGTSEERQIQVKTLLRELHRQYRAAKGEELTAIQNLAEDVIKDALASGELSADEGGAAKIRFWIYPATVADMGSPTGIVDDTGSTEDKIIEHDADFFNSFEDDFDDRDLN